MVFAGSCWKFLDIFLSLNNFTGLFLSCFHKRVVIRVKYRVYANKNCDSPHKNKCLANKEL